MRTVAKYILTALAAFVLTSCVHKDLCFHHPHTAKVRINVDWSEFDKETPAGMTVMIYPENGGNPVKHLTNTISHAYVNLEAGFYNSIVFNQSESEYGSVAFRGMDKYETAEVYTNTTKSPWYKTKADEEKLATEPEWIGVDRQEHSEVTQEMVDITGEHELMRARSMQDFIIATHTPKNIVYTLTVKVHVKGFQNLRSARASMTGLAEGYFLAEGRYSGSIVTQLLENWTKTVDSTDPTRGYITSTITCFGLPEGHGGRAEENEFKVSALLVDNNTMMDFTFKVGDLIEHDNNNLTLNLELELPEALPDVKPEGGSSSGFDAKVEDWGPEENYEIGI